MAIPFPKTGSVRKPDSRAARETRSFYLFIAPWLLSFVLLTTLPLAAGLLISFTNYTGLNINTVKFIGFDNYLRAFNDPYMRASLSRTAFFAALYVPLNIVAAFCLALALTRPIRGLGIFRTLFYIPSVIPVIASAWIWKAMMNNNFGLVNGVLSWFTPNTAIGWLTEFPTQVLTLMLLWASTGGTMIVFLAGLQNVPSDLEEAAEIDGANWVQVFRRVTIPLVTPAIFFQLIMSIIGALQVLAEPMLLAGSPAGDGMSAIPPADNNLYMVYTYRQIFAEGRYGYGTALLWLLFILILALTLVVFRSSRHWVYYEVAQEETRP
jgi:multiple sugar transport system permease protein